MKPGQASPYGSQNAPGGSPGRRGGASISVQTLIVASVASAVTSYTVSKIWGPGTLLSAAATPILVALISELVRHPVVKVSSTAQKVTGTPLRYRPSAPAGPRHPPRPAEPGSPATDEQWAPAGAPPVIAESRTGPRWRRVLVTGMLACLIVVGLVTALDVIAGTSITGNGDSSTFLSGPRTPPAASATPPAPALGPTTGSTGPSAAPNTTTTGPPIPAVGTTSSGSGATDPTPGATGAAGAPGGTGGTGGLTPTTAAPQPPASRPTGQ